MLFVACFAVLAFYTGRRRPLSALGRSDSVRGTPGRNYDGGI